jgi:hypothetical protein
MLASLLDALPFLKFRDASCALIAAVVCGFAGLIFSGPQGLLHVLGNKCTRDPIAEFDSIMMSKYRWFS